MSRITIDDCLVNCPNHFELAYHAAKRAQQIVRRADALVPEGDDKAIVVALREVARGALRAGALSADDHHAAAELADGIAAAEDNAAAAADGNDSAAAGGDSAAADGNDSAAAGGDDSAAAGGDDSAAAADDNATDGDDAAAEDDKLAASAAE